MSQRNCRRELRAPPGYQMSQQTHDSGSPLQPPGPVRREHTIPFPSDDPDPLPPEEPGRPHPRRPRHHGRPSRRCSGPSATRRPLRPSAVARICMRRLTWCEAERGRRGQPRLGRRRRSRRRNTPWELFLAWNWVETSPHRMRRMRGGLRAHHWPSAAAFDVPRRRPRPSTGSVRRRRREWSRSDKRPSVNEEALRQKGRFPPSLGFPEQSYRLGDRGRRGKPRGLSRSHDPHRSDLAMIASISVFGSVTPAARPWSM